MKHLKTYESYSVMDEILDKINDEGIDSLTKQELDILNNNGVIPEDIEDDTENDNDEMYSISDLEELVESEEDLDDYEPEWLISREKARELYNFNKDDFYNFNKVKSHYDKIIDYYNDENPPVFKAKIIKFFLNDIEEFEEMNVVESNKLKNELTKIYDDLVNKLEKIYE